MFHACSALVLTAEQICQWGSARAAFSNKVIANDRSGQQWQTAEMHKCRIPIPNTQLAGTGLAPIESRAFAIKQRNMGEKSQLFMMEMDKTAINLNPQMSDRLIEVYG